MNLLHMRYAVEVAKAGSINKASEALLIAQPNLSRSVKELESDLGITIFGRTAKGMFLTPEGAEFIERAQKILDQINEVESMYKDGAPSKQIFSVSVPPSARMSDAFANLIANSDRENTVIHYTEADTKQTLNSVISSDCRFGIIRYAEKYSSYFKAYLEEKGLAGRKLSEFTDCIVASSNSPLASLSEISVSDLSELTEAVHADMFVPTLAEAEVRKFELSESPEKRIFVNGSASTLELLSQNPDIFMFDGSIPKELLSRHGLFARSCIGAGKLRSELLVCKKNIKLTKLDKIFLSSLGGTENGTVV